MGRIEELAELYGQHIATPWQQTVAGAQRVVMVVYEKEYERVLRARRAAFENATRQAGHDWYELDLTDAFAKWMAQDEYREAYFEAPEDLGLKLRAEFPPYVGGCIRDALAGMRDPESSVLGIFGVGALFGFTRVSEVLNLIENDVQGRLVVFFPGTYDHNNYRLLDAHDGWNYMAVPIAVIASEGASR